MEKTNTNIVNFRNYSKPIKKVSLKRSNKKLIVSNKEIALDDLFQKLEVKRNASGRIIDTRFPPEVQEYIRTFLRNKHIEYNDTGYLSLRGAYQSLSPENKMELCININAKFDYGLNIEKEMKNAKGFFSAFKTASALTVGGAAVGTLAGGALHLVKPELIPNLVGQAGKDAVAKKLDDPAFQQDVVNRVSGAVSDFLDTQQETLVNTAKDVGEQVIREQVPNLAQSLETSVNNSIDSAVDSVANKVTLFDIGPSLGREVKGVAHNAVHGTLSDSHLHRQVADIAVDATTEYLDTHQNELIATAKETANKAINDAVPDAVASAKNAANDYIDNAVKTYSLPINLVTVGLTGLAVGAATAGVKSLVNIVKNINQRARRKKLSREILELDNVKYAEDNAIEAEKIRATLVQDNVIEEEGTKLKAA